MQIQLQKKTVISIGPYATYLIDAKDVSPLLAILERMTAVEREWLEEGSVYVLVPDREIEMRQEARPIITKAERDTRRAAEQEAREAAKLAEENAD